MRLSSGSVTVTLVDPAVDDFQPVPPFDTKQLLESYHVEGGPTKYTPHGVEQGSVSPAICLISQVNDATAKAVLSDLRRMIADPGAQPITVEWDDFAATDDDGPWWISGIAGEVESDFQGRIEFKLDMTPALQLLALEGVGAAGPAGHQHNDLYVGAEPWLDFVDAPGLTWDVVDDPSNSRIQISAAFTDPTLPAAPVLPDDYHYLAWSQSPGAGYHLTALVVKYVYLQKVKIPAGMTVNKIDMYVGTAGSGLTSAYVGVFDSAGNQLGRSANQTNWNATGLKSISLIAPVVLTAGDWVWVAILCNGTTGPALMEGGLCLPNMNLSAAESDSGAYGGTLTALPATLTPGSISQLGIAWRWWVALS